MSQLIKNLKETDWLASFAKQMHQFVLLLCKNSIEMRNKFKKSSETHVTNGVDS